MEETLWNELEPYFLPEELSIKKKLDLLFASAGVIKNLDSLHEAGFKVNRVSNKPTKVVVARHRKLKGYLLKLFTDESPVYNEWFHWKRRILGAKHVQQTIDQLNYCHLFKVPKKWIYPLPVNSSSSVSQKHFILVVEDMRIFKPLKNRSWWRSIAMTKELVDAIYTVFQTAGLADSVYPDNLPFSKDRKMAFVDTEHFNEWPIPFQRLTAVFSEEMQAYWLFLIHNGGPH